MMLQTNRLSNNDKRLIEALFGDLKTPNGGFYSDIYSIELTDGVESLLFYSLRDLYKIAEAQEINGNLSFSPTPYFDRDSDGSTVPVMRCIWVSLSYTDDLHYAYLKNRLNNLPCSPSAIVNNGEGLDAYWLLTEDLTTIETKKIAKRTMCWLATSLQGKTLNAESGKNDVRSFKRYMRVPGTIYYSFSNPQPVVVDHLNLGLRYSLRDLSFMAYELTHEKWPESAGQLGIL